MLAAVLGVVGLVALVATAARLLPLFFRSRGKRIRTERRLAGRDAGGDGKGRPAASGTHARLRKAQLKIRPRLKADSADQPLPKAMEPKGNRRLEASASAEWISLRKGVGRKDFDWCRGKALCTDSGFEATMFRLCENMICSESLFWRPASWRASVSFAVGSEISSG